MRLDLASVLLQWAAGGLAFLWVTVRRQEVGLGYGWLLRSSYAVIGAGGVAAGIAHDDHGFGASLRDGAGAVMVVGAVVALVVSVVGRDRGLVGFPVRLDLVAPAAGLVAVLGAADAVGDPYLLSLARLAIGAAFLGCVTDAMLLGHWYLVQPGLARDPIKELVRLGLWLTPIEIVVMFVPTGMVDVLSGDIDDGYGGLLGWMWVVCSAATVGLLLATRAALAERYYSAVMAATGLMYLAILTAFGTDVMARAVFAS